MFGESAGAGERLHSAPKKSVMDDEKIHAALDGLFERHAARIDGGADLGDAAVVRDLQLEILDVVLRADRRLLVRDRPGRVREVGLAQAENAGIAAVGGAIAALRFFDSYTRVNGTASSGK